MAKNMNAPVPVTKEELKDKIVSLYDKYLDEQTIVDATNYYLSPEGKSYVSKQKQIYDECTKAGQEYGEKISKKILDKMSTQKK